MEKNCMEKYALRNSLLLSISIGIHAIQGIVLISGSCIATTSIIGCQLKVWRAGSHVQ